MAKIRISEKKLLAKHSFIWFSMLILFMFCSIKSSFAATLDQKKITLPQKTEGIEKIEYTVDGAPRGSTTGKSTVGIDYGSSINFLIKIKPELHTKLTVGAVKVVSGSNDMLKLGIYKLDEDNKLTIEYPKDDELIDPNQTYVSQPYTVHSDESFSVNGVVPDTFVTSIKLENGDCTINEVLTVTYQVFGNKIETAEYLPENNSYLIKNIPPDKRVKIGIKTQEAYSQSKFTVIKDGKEMEYSEKENSVTLPAKAQDNELTIKNISKNKYSVLFESQEGINFKYKYENENSDFKDISSGTLNAVYGDSFLFTYLTNQENFMDNKEITLNGIALRSSEKVYSLRDIKEDVIISVKNKEDSSYNISLLPENAGAYVTDELGNKVSSAVVKYGDSYNFKIKAKEGYNKEINNALVYAIPTEKLTNNDYDTNKNSEEAKKYLISPSLDGTFSIDSVKEPISLLIKNLNLNTYVLEFPKTLDNGTYLVEENEAVKKLNETAYEVTHGTSVKVTVNPVEGKSTDKMTFECSGQEAKISKNGNVYTIENVTQDSSVEMNGIKDTEYTVKFDNPGAVCTNEYGSMYGINRDMTLTKSGVAKFKIQVINDEYVLEPEGIKANLKSGKATLTPPQDGEEYYTLSNIQGNIEIAITGIKRKPVSVQLNSDSKSTKIKSATGDTELPSQNQVDYGSDFNFKVESENTEKLYVVDESGEKVEPIQMQEKANLYSLKNVSQNTNIKVLSGNTEENYAYFSNGTSGDKPWEDSPSSNEKIKVRINPFKKLILNDPSTENFKFEISGANCRYGNTIKKIGTTRSNQGVINPPETRNLNLGSSLYYALNLDNNNYSYTPSESNKYFSQEIDSIFNKNASTGAIQSVTNYFEGEVNISAMITSSSDLDRISNKEFKIMYNNGNNETKELEPGQNFNLHEALRYCKVDNSGSKDSIPYRTSNLDSYVISKPAISVTKSDGMVTLNINIPYTYSSFSEESDGNSVYNFIFFNQLYLEPVIVPDTKMTIKFSSPMYGNETLEGVNFYEGTTLDEAHELKNDKTKILKSGESMTITTSYLTDYYSLASYIGIDSNLGLISVTENNVKVDDFQEDDDTANNFKNLTIEPIKHNITKDGYQYFCYKITNIATDTNSGVTIFPTISSDNDYSFYQVSLKDNGGVKYIPSPDNERLYGKDYVFDVTIMDEVENKYKYDNNLNDITISNTNNGKSMTIEANELLHATTGIEKEIVEFNEVTSEKKGDERIDHYLNRNVFYDKYGKIKRTETFFDGLKYIKVKVNGEKSKMKIEFIFTGLKSSEIRFTTSANMAKCTVIFKLQDNVSCFYGSEEFEGKSTSNESKRYEVLRTIYSYAEFRITVGDIYDSSTMTVNYIPELSDDKANPTEIIPNSSGVYRVKVRENIIITVDNLKKSKHTVIPTNYDYAKFILCGENGDEKGNFNSKKEFEYNDVLYFKLKIDNHYDSKSMKVYAQDTDGNMEQIEYMNDSSVIYKYTVTKPVVLTISDINPSTYTLTFKQDNSANGKIKFVNQYTLEELKNTINISYGNDYSFRIKADEGTDISNLQVYDTATEGGNNETQVLQPINGIYTIKNIDKNHIISYANTQKNKHKINFRTMSGVSCLNEDGNDIGTQIEVEHGNSYTFIVSVSDAYNHSTPTVKLKKEGTLDEDLTSVDGKKYTIKNITTDCTIVISNITKNSYKATFEPTEGVIYKTAKNKPFTEPQEVEYDGNFYFKISLMDAYDQSYPWVLLDGEKTLVENGGVYNLENIRSDVVITVKNVTKNPEEVTMDDVNKVPDEVATDNDINDVVKATLTYDSLSDEEKSKVTNTAKLKEAQQKVGELNHSEKGVSISGVDWNIKLVVTSLTEDEGKMKEFDQKVDRRSLISLYEIHLIDILTNKEYEVPYGKKVSVNIPAPDLTGYSNTVVAHEKKSGSMEYLDANIVDNTAQFQTSSFSLFGIAAKKIPNYSENPSDTQIAVSDLVDNEQELQSLLGEGLVSKLGNIMDDSEENNSESSNKNSDNNSNSEETSMDTDENSDSAYSSGGKKLGIGSIDLSKAYTWALDHEFVSVIIILIIGSLLIWLLIWLSRRKKDTEDEKKSNKSNQVKK